MSTTERQLPPPLVRELKGRETVQVTKAQSYNDGFVAKQGMEGLVLHPGSQAATWVIYFPEHKTRRVVPGWDLKVLKSRGH